MPNIPLHDSARPARLEAGMIAALRARRLPGRWLYEGESQARLWLAYHRAWSPSANDQEIERVYDEAFAGTAQAMGGEGTGRATRGDDTAQAMGGDDTVRAMGGGAKGQGGWGGLHVVSLGCGGGRKDAGLLKAIGRGGDAHAAKAVAYFPLDISKALVAEAAAHVADVLPGLPIHPLVADLGAWPRLDEWLDEWLDERPTGAQGCKHSGFQPLGPGARRLFSCMGMVPNFDPSALTAYLRGLLRPGDGLLISANLSPRGMEADKAGILAQYDNPLARRWYVGALEKLGLATGEDEHELRLTVSARALAASDNTLAADGSAWQVVVEATMPRAAAIRLGECEVTFEQGERLELFFSNRFTRKAFASLLESAGLHTREVWMHANEEEGIFFCPA